MSSRAAPRHLASSFTFVDGAAAPPAPVAAAAPVPDVEVPTAATNKAVNVTHDSLTGLLPGAYPPPSTTEVVTSPGGTNGERLPAHFASPSTTRARMRASHLQFAGDSSPGAVYATAKVTGRDLAPAAHGSIHAHAKTSSQWSLGAAPQPGSPGAGRSATGGGAVPVAAAGATAGDAPLPKDAAGVPAASAVAAAAARENRARIGGGTGALW